MAAVERPASLATVTQRIKTGCGHMYITVTLPESDYFEVFGVLGKTGGCAAAYISSVTRCLTVAVNNGAPLERLIKQLKGTRCPHDSEFLPSCPHALALVLEQYCCPPTQ